MLRGRKQSGFTIVELLIVVVVIAILAAITIVAYNGIQNRAKNSAALSSATQVAKKIAIWQIDNPSQVPSDLETTGIDTDNTSTTFEYTPGSTPIWCATITANKVSYYVSNTSNTPTAGGCAGHAVNGVPALINYATNPRAVSGGGSYTNQTPASGNVSYQATGAQDGGSAYRVITTVAGQLRIGIPSLVGSLVVGDSLSVGVDLYSSVATPVQVEVGIGGTYPKSSIINLNVGWNRVEGTVTPSVGGAVTLVQLVGTAASLPIGTTWTTSKAIITKGSTVYQYADGNSSNWVWNGTVNNSTSKGEPV